MIRQCCKVFKYGSQVWKHKPCFLIPLISTPYFNGGEFDIKCRHYTPSAIGDSKTNSSKTTESKILDSISLMETTNCSGCGVELQFEDENKIGYCSPQQLQKLTIANEIESLGCQRCFKMKHYGTLIPVDLPFSEYEKSIKSLRAQELVVVQLLDMLDIEGSLLPKLRYLFGKKPVILVLNKIDLLPKSANLHWLRSHLKQLIRDHEIENIVDIHFVSSAKGYGMQKCIDTIKKHREGRDICVIGSANAGKSSFLNYISGYKPKQKIQVNAVEDSDNEEPHENNPSFYLENLSEEEIETLMNATNETTVKQKSSHLTTSPLPGTTLGIRAIPLPKSICKNEYGKILDTPGLIVDKERQVLIEILSKGGSKNLSKCVPVSSLRRTTYLIHQGRSLFLGALIRVDFENDLAKNVKNRLLFSWNGALSGHLCKTENASSTYKEKAGVMLYPPSVEELKNLSPIKERLSICLKDYITENISTKSKNMKKTKRTSVVEIVFPGFGWLTITGVDLDGTQALAKTLQASTIRVFSCDGIRPSCRIPLYPYEMSLSHRRDWKC